MSPRSSSLVAVLFYSIAAGVLLLPALAAAPDGFLGHPQSDLYKHVWGHWWIAHALDTTGRWPTWTALLNYPEGGALFVIDPFNAAVSALLTRVLPPPAAFNLLVVGNLVFGGWAAWRLALRVTGDPAASLLAGVAYAFSPWVLCYTVGSGVSETLGLGWIPLACLSLLALLERPSAARAAGTALALVAAALNSWHFLLYSLALGGVALAGSLLAPGSGLPRPGRAWLRYLALALALAALSLAPLAARFLASFGEASSIAGPMRQRVGWLSARQDRYFAVSDFVLPGKDRLRVAEVVDRLAATPYVGLLVLAMAAAALRRPRPGTGVWAAGAGLFFLLSLGPAVAFTPGWRSGAPVNLLWALLSPLTGAWLTTTPFRLHFLTLLCLGVLASAGLARLARGRRSVAVLVGAAALLEVAWLSPAEFPVPVAAPPPAEAYAGLGPEGGHGLLDLPPLEGRTHLIPAVYFYGVTLHGQGIPYRTGGVFAEDYRTNPFFADMWRVGAGAPDLSPDPLADARGLEALAGMGYRHVVLHGDLLPPAEFRRALRTLRLWLGAPDLVAGPAIRFPLAPACGNEAQGQAPATTRRPAGSSPASTGSSLR